MRIDYINVSELIPYSKNTKKHDKKQINNVAESIKQYGFVQPIVIDKNKEVVIGHCRLLAAKQLKMQEVPCVCVDDLTEEQVTALRIVDNKSNESEWDLDFLADELADIDLTGFDLKFEFKSDKPKENERVRTITTYNLDLFDEYNVSGKYQMPIIRSTDFVPDDLIGFNYMKTSENKECGIHCFVDDYQFERLWNSPEKYIEALSEYQCFLSPDFSLYMDMPYAMKIWNVYRSRLIGQYYQSMGIEVIPTLSWAEKETFEFCFDGLEQGGTVAVSTIGVKQREDAYKIWKDGMTEAIHRLNPKNIIVYGGRLDFDSGNANVIYFENKVTEKMKRGKNSGWTWSKL